MNPTNPNLPFLRAAVEATYDHQKQRIAVGNRVVQAYLQSQGIEPGHKIEDDEKLAATLDDLRADYKRMTDGLVNLPQRAKFKPGKCIAYYELLTMMRHYEDLLHAETRAFRALQGHVEQFPIWHEFLEPIRGIGPALGAILIAYLDPHRAPRVSSYWKYCGYDVVTRFYLAKEIEQGAPPIIDTRHPERGGKPYRFADNRDGTLRLVHDDGRVLGHYRLGTDQPGEGAGRSRRKEHQISREYVDKDGEVKERASITFNPRLKTRLHVLAEVFLKTGSPYREHYDRYKASLETKPAWAERTKGHKHNAAMRYMIKMFLADLWAASRRLEGLPVTEPYHAAKNAA